MCYLSWPFKCRFDSPSHRERDNTQAFRMTWSWQASALKRKRGQGAGKGDSLSSPSDIQSFHIPTAWTDSICLKCSFSFLPRKPLNILPCSLKQEASIQVSSCHTAIFILSVKCGSNSSSRTDRQAPIKPTSLSRITRRVT